MIGFDHFLLIYYNERRGAEAPAHNKRFKQGYRPSDGANAAAPLRRVDGVSPLGAAAVAHWES